jgi:membrane-bound metal-dependent hydrolase YbcI (DUF457 family)
MLSKAGGKPFPSGNSVDIFTHAVVGAVTGSALGYPLTGAFVGIAPDLALGWRRLAQPPAAYQATHSALFTLVATYLNGLLWGDTIAVVTFMALASHLYLDFFTHGPAWGSPILYPFSHHRFSPIGKEWEFFNDVWWFGLALAVSWCVLVKILL